VTDVRPAAFGDVAQIVEVHVAGWHVGYRGLLPQAFLDGLTAADRLSRWPARIGRHRPECAGEPTSSAPPTTPPYAPPPTGSSASSTAACDTPPPTTTTPTGPTHKPPLDT